MNYKELIDLLKGHRVFLQTHDFPDPDALASAYGMKRFLQHFEIDATIVYSGEVEKISTKRMFTDFNIDAKNITDISDMTDEDYIVYIDVQKYNSNVTDFVGNEVACIDHHPTVKQYPYKYSDVRICGACASLVTGYFQAAGISMDENTATALLYGIKIDTDSFNRGVTRYDVEKYAYLLDIADNQKITTLYNNTMELDDLHAYGEAIRNIHVYGNVGFACIGFECQDSLIAMVSDFILRLDIVELAVVYASRNGGYKFSVRNESDHFNAGTITSLALEGLGGGGGHASMAGGMIIEKYMPLLGEDHDNAIEQKFIKVINAP